MKGGDEVTIDGVDVSAYGVQQWTIEPEISEIKNASEWMAGSNIPTMLKSTIGFKKMKIGIMIRGNSRQDIWQKANAFIAKLLEPREYQFDGFSHFFYGYIKNAQQAETSLRRWHKATLEWEGVEYGSQVSTQANLFYSVSPDRKMNIKNDGTVVTPAIVEIKPVINLADLTLTGLVRNSYTGEEKPIRINNLTNGQTIVIDGESGLVTQNGANKFVDVDLWDLPTLKPGANVITADKDVSITIRHKPRYL